PSRVAPRRTGCRGVDETLRPALAEPRDRQRNPGTPAQTVRLSYIRCSAPRNEASDDQTAAPAPSRPRLSLRAESPGTRRRRRPSGPVVLRRVPSGLLSAHGARDLLSGRDRSRRAGEDLLLRPLSRADGPRPRRVRPCVRGPRTDA